MICVATVLLFPDPSENVNKNKTKQVKKSYHTNIAVFQETYTTSPTITLYP